MCGRYTLASGPEIIAGVFGVQAPPTLPERFNISPSQLVLAVREKSGSHQRELVALKWGLVPFWADHPEIGNQMANARSETAAMKPAFRSSFRARRCLIVADGFYEWQARDGKKQPYYIRLKSGQPFGIAGLWDRWDKQEGEPVESCTILTCNANEPMMAIHERMPVVIPPESFGVWLNPAEHDVPKLSWLLRPFHPDEMTAYPVSTFVNNVKQDSAKCVEPLEVR
jgi:putative SOS response-associated peptidase YedK